jgi:hypothetical protein
VCSFDLNTSCVVEIPILVTPTKEEECVTELDLPCDKIVELQTIMSAPIAEVNTSIDMSPTNELIAVDTEPCDLTIKSDLDRIVLVRNDEILAKISLDTTLWSITMDPAIPLSHTRHKISEVTCLSTLKSIYAPKFKFNLIGDYGVDNIFLVHRICITCDDLAMLKENKLIRMLDHFDMTSNSGINFMPNNMLHDSLFKPVVACNFEILNFGVPTLGWFNDGHCKVNYNDKCFTYICNLSCHTCFWNMTNRVRHYYELYSCEVLIVKHVRGVKTDDIYIYHVFTLSLLLVCL